MFEVGKSWRTWILNGLHYRAGLSALLTFLYLLTYLSIDEILSYPVPLSSVVAEICAGNAAGDKESLHWQHIFLSIGVTFGVHRTGVREPPLFGVGRTVPHSSGAWQQNNSDCPSPNTEDTQKVHYNITGFNSCSKLRFSNVSCVWNGWGIGP